MNKLLTLLLLSPLAFAEEAIDFNLTCNVKDQVIFSIEDGKSSRFSGYKDGIKTGESFIINFNFKYTDDTYQLYINSEELALITRYYSDAVTKYPKMYAYDSDSVGFVGNISPSSIYINGLFTKAVLERYFKNDWQLIKTSIIEPEGTRMLTANCMNMSNKFDSIINVIEKISGELSG